MAVTSADCLPGLFDTHAHLNDPRFDEDREQVLKEMTEREMLNVCVGSDIPTSRSGIELARRWPGLYAAVGIHPHEASTFREEDLSTLEDWLLHEPRVVALGEIGLDFYYDYSPREVQREVFARQLELGFRLDVPVILHIRDAHGECMDMMRARRDRLPRCVIHCCSASWESARVYLDLGCMISFAGPVTFKKSHHLQECARNVPEDRLLIETDSPYLAPEPVRGRRNRPQNVEHICRFLSQLRGVSPEELCRRTRKNGMEFYRIGGSSR